MLLRYLSGNGSKGSAEYRCVELWLQANFYLEVNIFLAPSPSGVMEKTPKKIIRIILNINPKEGSVKDCERSSNPERWPTQVTSTGAQTNIVEPTSRQCQWPPPGAAASTPLSNSLLSQHRFAMLGSRRLGGVRI